MQWRVSDLLHELDRNYRNAVLHMPANLNDAVANGPGRLYQVGYRAQVPILRDDTSLGLFVSIPHAHIAPIFARCASTRAASTATSSVSCGSGVA